MVLPFRAKTAMDAGVSGFGFRELCETYGRMIGHHYSDLAEEDEGRVHRFSNISLPEACATVFDQALSRFTMSDNQNGLDLVMISIPSPGTELVYQQRGETIVARNGEAIVHSTAERLVSHSSEVARVLAVALPRKKLGPLVRNDDLTQMRLLPAADPATRLLTSYAETLLTLEGDPDFVLADRVGDQLAELAALAIGASKRGRDKAEDGQSVQDARMHQARQFIKRQLSDPGLNEKAIAASLRLSESTIRQLFAQQGSSVGRTIREMRLSRAYMILSHPTLKDQKIVDIAADCGFESLSAFYRNFRMVYGVSPSDIRGRT